MPIGRTYKDAFLTGMRSLVLGKDGSLFGRRATEEGADAAPATTEEEEAALRRKLVIPNDRRMWELFRALDLGWDIERLHELTNIDPWFLQQFKEIVELRKTAEMIGLRDMSYDLMRTLKRSGFGDKELADILGVNETAVREKRQELRVRTVFKRIDTCAAEFESFTPYLYSSFEATCEADPTDQQKIIILGSGPNRIGQGIEFDYCCCHAVFGFKAEGFETVMINCNPETVSTDYDTADRLYFEPLTFEDVMAVIEREREGNVDVSCVVQFGGQTPLKLALALQEAGVNIIGTSPDSIDLAEDRQRFNQLLWDLGIPQPPSGTAISKAEAREVAARVGFPVVVRPSYVLGGRAMAIVFDVATLDRYMASAVDVSHDRPILIDRFLEHAKEIDVDCVADQAGAVVIGGIMEHIEEAGIHSGDSSCVVPPPYLNDRHVATIRDYTRRIAKALKVVGLMNVQYAIKDNVV
jgi:carbamoyl-phosphate synthase large subunit